MTKEKASKDGISKRFRFHKETYIWAARFDVARRQNRKKAFFSISEFEDYSRQWRVFLCKTSREEFREWLNKKIDRDHKSITSAFLSFARRGRRFLNNYQSREQVLQQGEDCVMNFIFKNKIDRLVVKYINELRRALLSRPFRNLHVALATFKKDEARAHGNEASFEWLARQARIALIFAKRDDLVAELNKLPPLMDLYHTRYDYTFKNQ